METQVDQVKRRFHSLKTTSQEWIPLWRDIATWIKPTRGFFPGDLPNKAKRVDAKKVLVATASRAVRTMAAGMMSGLTNPSVQWFKLGFEDNNLMDVYDVKLWLDEVQKRMTSVFQKSNIYEVLHTIYEELGCFGTASALIEADFESVIRGRAYTIGEYFLGTDRSGRVDTFAREMQMTSGQMVEEFGKDKVSYNVLKSYEEGRRETYFPVCMLIDKNPESDPSKVDAKSMEYSLFYWQPGEQDFLLKGGFNSFPILAPRWDLTTTSSVYGVSPGWSALGDVKMLQKMQRDKLLNIDMNNNPPILAEANLGKEINLLPGGISYIGGAVQNGAVRPVYQVNTVTQDIDRSIELTKNDINEEFYVDLFKMMIESDRRQMTAREVMERATEKMSVLGPVIDKLRKELLDPLIDRTFNIMHDMGIIPQPPEAIQGQDLKVEYISVLAMAQKMSGITPIEQSVAFGGNLAGVNPEVLDNYNFDEAVRHYADLTGVPVNILRSMDEVALIRKGRQQQMQAQQDAQNMQAAIQGAQVLSKTDTGTNNALTALVGGGVPA